MEAMRVAWILAAWLAVPADLASQAQSTLHIRVTLLDAARTPTPIPRHALLISDNPATSEPRRVLTRADGTVEVRLRPGSYTVESDRPVAFLGQAYQWTEIVELVAGRDATLELTAKNAEVVPLTAAPAESGRSPAEGNPLVLAAKWQSSVVAVWSPTSRASGFVVDQRGLIATHRSATGQAPSVEVQLSATAKVPARVLFSDRSSDVAILWVEPGIVAGAPPVPMACPPATVPPLDDGQEIVALTQPHRGPGDAVTGDVLALYPRAVETDLRLAFGGVGGPVFDQSGSLVGLTSEAEDAGTRRPGYVNIVRPGLLCEALTSARSALSSGTPPSPTPLPVEPTRAFPIEAVKASTPGASAAAPPPVLSSSDFDVAFITPPMVYAARQKADWTGGASGRSPEAAARLGRLTDFHGWSDYFADVPPVLIVRVTPKMAEGFWKRLAREAARTQGAVIPPLRDFTTSFVRLRALCDGAEVTPIHPFVLEHRGKDEDVVREGLYVFAPDAFGPRCGRVSLELVSEKSPKADALAIDPKAIDRIWQDFAPYRASGG
jgi:hypothetical protein